ncbi:MAG: hypothetical protein H8E14_08000 [Candidatus Marinimicrobia bacterium]|nr:hypothetical protein [Candidatus Neomarinimicrobiota bacterium]
MTRYSHRERVLTALQHQEPDRIPLDLMGNASMLLDESYLKLREHLGLTEIPPIRSGSTANYYDERILEHFDIDFRRIFLNKSIPNRVLVHADGSYTDIWGIRFQRLGPFVNAVGHPLAGLKSEKELARYTWPTGSDLYNTSGLAEKAQQLFNETDYALVARNPLSEGFLGLGSYLMGMEEFYIALIKKPEFIRRIIKQILVIYKEVYAMFLDAVGPYVQMVEVADDLGAQDNLLISPTMYRELIKPAERELYALIHEKAPGAALFRHNDGAIFEIIPDLIEVGVDILNPVQTSVKGLEAQRIKATFGDQLNFHGGMEYFDGDVSTEAVVTEVKKLIDGLANCGGYILAPCNHIITANPENICTMYYTARDYGKYR